VISFKIYRPNTQTHTHTPETDCNTRTTKWWVAIVSTALRRQRVGVAHVPRGLEDSQQSRAAQHADAKCRHHAAVVEDGFDDAAQHDEAVETIEQRHEVALDAETVQLEQHLHREQTDEEQVRDLCQRQHSVQNFRLSQRTLQDKYTTTTVLRPFFRDHPDEAVPKLLLDFMVQGRITRGRHTDNPGGRHSIRTNQQSTSINPPIFMPDALPAATLPIYPGLGQAQKYAGLHTLHTLQYSNRISAA